MARLGMDVDAVEGIAKQLQSLADQISSLESQINGKVQQLPGIWDGRDAQTFVTQWWPQHQKALKSAAEAVKGLGQSALNNASQQREVSSH
ncbi:WXG100 family type VII secretion target [Pengzhenrongella sicca]|uniref:WXG100 family type VII secretion target n=1 Tax=Pengzhenrongella sicca TaxID=2819238 RepID=A0A8A4ZER7_9MICO|nr:WXG100 family type VII secretion target [Pengzhenrongella sicca]QTE28987.1 WXG100 family type VII secretion target [Pengzhenrongella sicca]